MCLKNCIRASSEGNHIKLFYFGYCKDQRNTAVIILRYTTQFTRLFFRYYVKKSVLLIFMVAYFCHHLSDNYVDLSDLYVVLSDLYVDLSDLYVDLSLINLLENES